MRSIINELHTTNFPRVRIGTGMPEYKEMLVSYVIEKLKDEEYEKLVPAIEKAAKDITDIVKHGVDYAMNLNN